MQSSTSNFTRAMSGGAVTWAPPRVKVDWDGDGYSGPGTIDDLTGSVGRPVTVTHYLDDGFPNEVSFVAGLGTAETSVPLPAAPRPPAAATVYSRPWIGQIANGTSGGLGGTVTAPSGAVRAGDMLVLAVSTGSTTPTVATPDGWAATDDSPTDDGVVLRSYIYTREAVEDDEAGFDTDVVLSSSNRYTAVLVAVCGVSARGGVGFEIPDADQVNETVSGTSHVTPTVTATNRQSVLLSVFVRAVVGSGTWATSPDTQLVQVCGADPANNNAAMLVALSAVVGAGDYSRTATTSGAVGNATMAAVVVSVRQTEDMPASRYYSPFNTASPVYGYPRDTSRLKVDIPVVTAAGVETVRVFTGQMSNLPVRGQAATVEGISRARLRLAKLIQPPPIRGKTEGLHATWPVSWAMHKCGVYASPPPRAGVRLWAPMHGSLRPFLPDEHPSQGITTDAGGLIYQSLWDGVTETFAEYPGQVDGPYVTGMDAYINTETAARVELYGKALYTPAGAVDLLSQAGNAGRFEWAVRGDVANINTTPAGSGGLDGLMSGWRLQNDAPGGFRTVKCGVRLTDRVLYVAVYDGTTNATMTGPALPSDGEWHNIGFGYDFAGQKLWVYYDGAVVDFPATGTVATSLSPIDNWGEVPDPTPTFGSYLPVAELHVTSGVEANPDNYPWVWDDGYIWEVGAQIVPSGTVLEALAETQPREAWEFIGSYAQGELAVLRTDELDVVRYLTRRWWTETAQQTISGVLSTTQNVGDVEVEYDPSKVRNSIRVTYPATVVTTNQVLLFSLSEAVAVPMGSTTYRLVFNLPTVYASRAAPLALTALDVTNNTYLGLVPGGFNFMTVNTSPFGTGAYLGSPQVTATVHEDWDAATVSITIVNASGAVAYLANNGSTPFLGLVGFGVEVNDVSVTVSDVNSIAVRGERALPVSLPAVQREREALQVASALVGDLAWPVATISKASVYGDPRRQPGDLVTFEDAANTDVDGQWRVTGVGHRVDGANYTQAVTVQRSTPLGDWDIDDWDTFAWE